MRTCLAEGVGGVCIGVGHFSGHGASYFEENDEIFWDMIDLWIRRGLRHAEEEP